MIPFPPYLIYNQGEGLFLTKSYKYIPKNIYIIKNHLNQLTDEDLKCRFGVTIGKDRKNFISLASKTFETSTWFCLQSVFRGELIAIVDVHDGELSFSVLPKYRNRGLISFLIQTTINSIGKEKIYIAHYSKNFAARKIANKFDIKSIIMD